MTRKINFFWGVLLIQIQLHGTGTRYVLENLQQCGKSFKNKSHRILWANSYVFRSYKEKTGRRVFWTPPPLSLPPPPPPLPLSWVELKLSQNSQENTCARISSCKLPKLAGRGCNFFKNEALAPVFSCEFYDNLRTPILQNTSGRLLV